MWPSMHGLFIMEEQPAKWDILVAVVCILSWRTVNAGKYWTLCLFLVVFMKNCYFSFLVTQEKNLQFVIEYMYDNGWITLCIFIKLLGNAELSYLIVHTMPSNEWEIKLFISKHYFVCLILWLAVLSIFFLPEKQTIIILNWALLSVSPRLPLNRQIFCMLIGMFYISHQASVKEF